MAEVAVAPETEQTPPEDVAVVSPESPTEAAPAPENVEETSPVDAILDSIGAASTANAGENDTNATPDPVVPPEPQQSPEQIRQQERERVTAENRINGLKWVVTQDAPDKLAKLANQLDEEGREILRTELNRIKGAFDPLLQRAVDVDTNIAPQHRNQGWNEAVTDMSNQVWKALPDVLGEDGAKAVQGSLPQNATWGHMANAIAKEARKGYVPAKDYVSKASTQEHLAKFEAALKDRAAQGIVTSSLRELNGTGGQDLPAARTSGRLQPGSQEWAEEAPVSELLADRARRASA